MRKENGNKMGDGEKEMPHVHTRGRGNVTPNRKSFVISEVAQIIAKFQNNWSMGIKSPTDHNYSPTLD